MVLSLKLILTLGLIEGIGFVQLPDGELADWVQIVNATSSFVFTFLRSTRGVIIFVMYVCRKSLFRSFKSLIKRWSTSKSANFQTESVGGNHRQGRQVMVEEKSIHCVMEAKVSSCTHVGCCDEKNGGTTTNSITTTTTTTTTTNTNDVSSQYNSPRKSTSKKYNTSSKRTNNNNNNKSKKHHTRRKKDKKMRRVMSTWERMKLEYVGNNGDTISTTMETSFPDSQCSPQPLVEVVQVHKVQVYVGGTEMYGERPGDKVGYRHTVDVHKTRFHEEKQDRRRCKSI